MIYRRQFHGHAAHTDLFLTIYRNDEELRLNGIKSTLQKTLRDPEDSDGVVNAEFDYSLPAVCEVPKHFNISEWFGQKTWNIFFKPNYRQFNIKEIFLR